MAARATPCSSRPVPDLTEPQPADESSRRRRGALTIGALAVVVALGGLAVALTGDDDEASPSPSSTTDPAPTPVEVDCRAWDALGGGEATADADDAAGEPLPGDDELLTGTLDNELDYYVRRNERPGDSVVLALAVDAGAALEDDDQLGAAHFLEHMLFNGTEGYPGNELTDALARLGVEFGADLNAYTNADETVYYLDLANDADSIDRGLDILLEWATRATIRPDDVDDERGVVLEELRTRLDPGTRFFDRVQDLALADTPYEGKRVIGTEASVEAMTPEALRRFYEDWYRPELMSVIAVGDIDPGTLERAIRDRFAAIDPVEGPDPPDLDPARPDGPRLRTYLDDELAGTSAEVVFTREAGPATTRDDVRRELLRQVGLTVVSDRLNDDAARGLVPFYEVDVDLYGPVDTYESLFLSVDAEPEQLDEALGHVLAELARIRRDGLGDTEVARAVADRRAGAVARAERAATSQDRDVTFRLVDTALDGAPATPDEADARAEIELLDDMDAAAVAGELRATTGCAAMAVQAGVPSDYEEHLPDEEAIAGAIIAATGDGALPERPASPEAPAELLAPPAPVTPVERRGVELVYGPARYLRYDNGVQVVVNPSDIEAGSFRIDGQSPGGLAEVDEADLPSARVASRLANDSGVGDLDSVQLDEVLAGRNASASTSLGVDRDFVVASGSVGDAESVFALLHQRMAAPRVDEGAVATLRGEARLTAEDPGRRASSAVTDARDELLWRDDPRYRDLLRADDLEQLDPTLARDIHAERFGDAGDFVFTIVGDIDLDTAEDLANRYLGTLPASGRSDDGAHTPPAPPDAVATRTVEAGEAQQARVEVVHDVAVAVDPVVRDRADALVAVLRNQLRDRIREELGASYAPTIGVDTDERTGRVRTSVVVESDPERVDEIATEVQQALADLRTTGPGEDELALALEPILRDLRFIDLAGISEAWTYVLTHPERPVQDVPAAAELRLDGLTPDDVRGLAERLLPGDAYVEIIQVPAS